MRREVRILAVAAALGLLAAAPLLAGFAGTDVFLPSVGRRPGNNNSQYYTMLWIHNPSASTANVTISFLLRNQPNPSPATYYDTIPAGDSHSYPDTISALFQAQAWGALRITANVRVLAVCRMYNLPAGGQDKDTQGQGYNAIPASFAIGSGQSTKLLGVSQTIPKADSEFRYSFGWVEAAGGTANVQVVAYDETGTQVASKTYPTTGAYEARYYAIEDLYPAVNATNLTLQVSVVSGSGKVIPVGSGTANVSNDSTTFEMQFADSLLGGSGGLSVVTHDASLTGDGTTTNALGIADAGVGKSKLRAGGGTNGQVLGTDGTNLLWLSAAGLSLPYAGTGASTGALFAVTNTVSGPAIQGTSPFSSSALSAGVVGRSGNPSSAAASPNYGFGVWGDSQQGIGVAGSSDQAEGMLAVSTHGPGILAASTDGDGIIAGSTNGYAGTFNGRVKVSASSAAGTDIFTVANSGNGRGLYVNAKSDTAVWAISTSGIGVDARSTSNNGINASSTTGYAGDFFGNVNVTGTLSAATKNFRIDHPLDPANKYLVHTSVESPDMLDVYTGNVVTDDDGRAPVQLPAWFGALNADFRYQLTVIGRFAQAIVEEEISDNRFVIRTSVPRVKVSWQVTGIRHDAYAIANRTPVEEDKPAEERGFYLHPELFGQPAEKSVEWAERHRAASAGGGPERPDAGTPPKGSTGP